MTDLVHKSGPQPGFVVVLELLPDGSRFDRETREQLLDAFRDAADFWGERKIAFRVFYSIAVSGKESAGNWDKVEVAQNDPAAKPVKVSKNAPQPMIMNLPPHEQRVRHRHAAGRSLISATNAGSPRTYCAKGKRPLRAVFAWCA